VTYIDPAASGLCTDPGCRVHSEASIPRTAADGLRLCTVHVRRLAQNTLLCAARHRECELALSGTTGNVGTRVSGDSGGRNAPVNQGAIDARADIERVLLRYTSLIVSVRGFAWPTEWHVSERVDGFIGPLRMVRRSSYRTPVLARFVANSAEWLAARDDAGTTSVELQMVADRARAVAFPAGVKRFPLQHGGGYVACDRVVDEGQPCPGVLWAVIRERGAALICNHDSEHVVPPQLWLRLGQTIKEAA
jgi:hypothetical protein